MVLNIRKQPIVDPLRRMALLVPSSLVLLEPGVDQLLMRVELRCPSRLVGRSRREIFLHEVFPDRLFIDGQLSSYSRHRLPISGHLLEHLLIWGMLSTSLYPPLSLLALRPGIVDPKGAASQLPLIFSGNFPWRNQGTPRGVFREFQLTSNRYPNAETNPRASRVIFKRLKGSSWAS